MPALPVLTHGPRPLEKKICDPIELAELLRGRKNKRVVFTNGCFDLLHPGHVRYLESARSRGEILVVAINSDDSVRKIKGPERPLNVLSDRMEVLAALESVDFVTWFEEADPVQLIQHLRPDVLVKGGDWKVDQILGASDVLGWGGTVESLPFVPGKSTTSLIEKARSQK